MKFHIGLYSSHLSWLKETIEVTPEEKSVIAKPKVNLQDNAIVRVYLGYESSFHVDRMVATIHIKDLPTGSSSTSRIKVDLFTEKGEFAAKATWLTPEKELKTEVEIPQNGYINTGIEGMPDVLILPSVNISTKLMANASEPRKEIESISTKSYEENLEMSLYNNHFLKKINYDTPREAQEINYEMSNVNYSKTRTGTGVYMSGAFDNLPKREKKKTRPRKDL